MTYNKSIFKWAGGKGKALKHLLPILEKHKSKTFVEPFVGAANVSLNFDSDNYIWNDINEYLIKTYAYLLVYNNKDDYISRCQKLFDRGYDDYYKIREEFNQKHRSIEELISRFQYVNKAGFNGLYRVNKKGDCNVPIGTVKKSIPKVPVEAIEVLVNRHEGNTYLTCGTYEDVFLRVEQLEDCLIYCDSPYVPLTTEFKYSPEGFNEDDHIKLKELSKNSKHTTIISNHWTDFTKELYKDADEIYTFPVQRTISCDKGTRKKVEEVVAVYYSKKP